MSEDNSQVKRTHPKYSLWHNFLHGMWGTYLFGFLIVVLMSVYTWVANGYEASTQNLEQKIYREAKDMRLRSPALMDKVMGITSWFNNTIDETKAKLVHTTKGLSKTEPRFLKQEAKAKQKTGVAVLDFSDIGAEITGVLAKVKSMLWLSFVFLLLKVVEVYAATLLYVFAALLGALDGLMKRYVRTEEGGRESTFAFHWVTSILVKLPFLVIALYYVLPVQVNPVVIMALIGISLFFIFNTFTSSLKKFL